MKVYNNFPSNPEDPIRFWHFQEYENVVKNKFNLFVGDYRPLETQTPSLKDPNIFINMEEVFDDRDTTDSVIAPYVDHQFTISKCAANNKPNRTYIYFPLNEKCLPDKISDTSNKIFDVIYTGLYPSHGGFYIDEIFQTIQFFNHALVGYNYGTHIDVTYREKLELISKSKITVTHNIHRGNAGQLKSRPFEAAFCKSLILCNELHSEYLQPWFEEDVHYVTYKMGELGSKLKEILNDFSNYSDMIDRAYSHAINKFTVKNFVEDFLIDNKIDKLAIS
mgnify:CR=1 FL=1|tara:strand:+ start:1773 stop:2606 length:834 start_codon:yes stop_codon:yes gene_type:complete